MTHDPISVIDPDIAHECRAVYGDLEKSEAMMQEFQQVRNAGVWLTWDYANYFKHGVGRDPESGYWPGML